jgi:hypothetical protein
MSKSPACPPTPPNEFSQVESPSQARRASLEAPPPSSTAQAQRGTVDSLVQASLVDLFQAYGIAVAPMPRSARERPPPLPDISATIGFTNEARRPGRLTLSLPGAVLGLMKGEAQSGFRQTDWARELTNQLMGRIKNRMLQFSVRLQAGLPSILDSKLLESQLQDSATKVRAYAGRTLRGEVVATIEGMPDDLELKYVGPGRALSEGDTIFF